MEQDVVQAFLKRGGEIAMLVGDFRRRRAGRDQVRVQIVARGEIVFALVAGFVEAQHRDADRAIVAEGDFPREKIAEARGIAIGREAHDFVFVGIEVEAEMQRDERIENADGILRGKGGDAIEFAVAALEDTRAVRLAHGIDRRRRGIRPSRRCSRRWRRGRDDGVHGGCGRGESLSGRAG